MKKEINVNNLLQFNLTIRRLPIVIFSLVTLIFISLFGCVGPKMASFNPSNSNYIRGELIPSNKSVSILVKDDEVNKIFAEIFCQELEASTLFNKVSKTAYNEKANTDLVIELLSVSSGRGGTSPAFYKYVNVEGNLLDTQQNKVIFEFKLMKGSMGGLLGAGGLAAAGNETMIKQLSKWISEELVENIKDRISNN